MKHLKIRAELSPSRDKVVLTILQQTSFAIDFGNSQPYSTGDAWNRFGDCAFVVGNKCLVSHPWNEFRIGIAGTAYGFWLLLPCNTGDVIPTEVTLLEWSWIKPLIEAYNEWGRDK